MTIVNLVKYIFRNIQLNISKVTLLCLLTISAVMLSGCTPSSEKINWEYNFSKDSKDPYGLYLSYHVLNELFPEAEIEELNSRTNFSRLLNRLEFEHNATLIFVGNELYLTDQEANDLIALVEEGKNLFIATMGISYNFKEMLNLSHQYFNPSNNNTVAQCFTFQENKNREYCFKGKLQSEYHKLYFNKKEQFSTIGMTSEGIENYIVYNIGKGKLYLHSNPVVMTNYFLTQNNNQQYLEQMFSYIGKSDKVLWMNYNVREASDYGDWDILWRNKSTRIFLIISLVTLVLFVLFEMKRRQRIIPITEANTNTSVSFVETIGRLYYNSSQHHNLAEKMIQHFFEFVRSNYYLNTEVLDADFETNLASKSGKTKEQVSQLMQLIRQVKKGTSVDDEFLFNLHFRIQEFYIH